MNNEEFTLKTLRDLLDAFRKECRKQTTNCTHLGARNILRAAEKESWTVEHTLDRITMDMEGNIDTF